MSARPRQADAGALFPPIEVGSFVSRRPDKSEFIGSASGVFFINTVFRAFAAASPCEAELAGGAGTDRATADPGSFHNLLTAADDTSQEQLADGDVLLKLINSSTGMSFDGSRGQSYGINIPELGAPPTPAAAKKLLMIYFQKWHPIFPFLHGPTFFDKVNQFYSTQSPDNRDAGFGESLRDKLCRAVCFQCVFNIAATNADGELLLEPRCRITSPAVLTGLLGIIAGDQDMHTLQVLLAMELYLVTRMSSRAASTVHGTLTRVLYQAGFHRCPFRYLQMPKDMLVIRQRIWWCTYVLDRHLSLSLGHPLAVSDEEVDVCIPGMPELHSPVGYYRQVSTTTAGDEVRAHLPINHESFQRDSGMASSSPTTNADCSDTQTTSDANISNEISTSDVSLDAAEEARNKRRKSNHNVATQSPLWSNTECASSPGLASSYMWQPVLEYTGPDFGFDANQFCRQDAWQEFLAQGLNPGLSGLLFENSGWDSYVKTFGNRLS
ncbi:hypothetical protein MY11210_001864 [Beauveria gryllotalpidicola]